MWDTANQYVVTAINGGLLGLIILIAIIVFGFKYLARARNATPDKKQALFFWALGSAFFAYTVSFFGISLWDQSVVLWYALLAFIGAVAAPQKLKAAAPQFSPEVKPATALPRFAPANRLASPWR
jgi:O-antigen ligase